MVLTHLSEFQRPAILLTVHATSLCLPGQEPNWFEFSEEICLRFHLLVHWLLSILASSNWAPLKDYQPTVYYTTIIFLGKPKSSCYHCCNFGFEHTCRKWQYSRVRFQAQVRYCNSLVCAECESAKMIIYRIVHQSTKLNGEKLQPRQIADQYCTCNCA